MITERTQKYNIMPFLIFNVVMGSLHPIFLNLGKTDGKIMFSSISVAFMIEFIKLTLSALLFTREVMTSNNNFRCPDKKNLLMYSIPALLYMVNNNLVTHSQNHMDPATFHMLNNLKIVSTAVLHKLIINKHLTTKQWLSIIMLFMAGVLHSFSGLKDETGNSAKELYITWSGIYIVCAYCLISAFAGVYTEAIMKKYRSSSIHMQNLIMYSFGIIMNCLAFVSYQFSNQQYVSFFEGFSVWTWSIIITQSVNGIIISFVMKHASNITRLFVIGTSILLTSILSYIILNIQLNLLFCVSFLITLYALFLYNN